MPIAHLEPRKIRSRRAEGFGGGIALERTQTIMQGASHCDFRFRRRGA
jgi:hypothetical protein